MPNFPFTVTEGNITILINGSLNKIPKTHVGFNALTEHLKTGKHDAELILQLLDKRTAVSRLTSDNVTVVGNTVFYKGAPVHGTLSTRLVEMMDSGYDAMPWVNFMNNIMNNPSDNSRACLFEFIDRFDTPLTDDGCFVAFKGVRDDYTDVRTGTFDNAPGKTVTMDRADVVEDPNLTCSAGLHVCASHYLDSFWGNNKVIAVKVNPKDVVSVPNDYNFSKMRVCEYVVLSDVEDERHRTKIEQSQVVDTTSQPLSVTSAKPTETANGYVIPEGWIMNDDVWPEEGESVIKPGSLDIGVIRYCGEICADDAAHPQYDEWESGDIAWNDTDNMFLTVVDFGGVSDEEFVTPDGDDTTLRVVVMEEDDDTPEFVHVASGQTFSQEDVLNIVSDIGQRGFANAYGVPRTTVQGWLSSIK